MKSFEDLSDRTTRGGSWCSVSTRCRAAYRLRFAPGDRFSTLGFRVCLSAVDRTSSPSSVLPSNRLPTGSP